MKVRSVLAAFAAVLSLTTFNAQAEDAATTATAVPAPGVSSASEGSLTTNIWKNMFADFASSYHGPTVKEFGPYSQNAIGEVDPKALAGFENNLNVAYMLSTARGIGMGPDIWFYYQPNKTGKDQFTLNDVGLKTFYKNTMVTDHFRLYTNAIVQAPTSEYSREHNVAFSLRTTPFVIYDIGQTRWRVGSWSDFRYLVGASSGLSFKAYVQPYVAYKLNDSVMLTAAYETEADRDVGTPALKFHDVLRDFQPGVAWQVNKKLKLTANLLYFMDQKISTQSTGIAAGLYSQLL
jgi:hypothetical protein